MKIVIVGCGKVGYTLAGQLSVENHDVTIVDNNSRIIEKAQETLDVMSVSGNGAALDIQREARVGDADLLIATTGSDELNLLCCIVAKRLGCRHTISRVRNADYIEQIPFMRDDFGLSMTVNPEYATAQTICRFLQFPSFLKIDSFAKGLVELVELKLAENSVLVGKSLDKLSTELHLKVLVCVVERDNRIFIPKGDFILRAGDKINVTAPRSELTKMIKKLNISTQKIRNVMLIGGGRVAEYLTEELIRSDIAAGSCHVCEVDGRIQCTFSASEQLFKSFVKLSLDPSKLFPELNPHTIIQFFDNSEKRFFCFQKTVQLRFVTQEQRIFKRFPNAQIYLSLL